MFQVFLFDVVISI